MTKKNFESLAVLGGPPAFREPLHVGRPNVGNRERLLGRITEILDRRWLTNAGRCVREFEERIAEYTGVRHCVAMCNGTVALEIAIRALGMKGEVILPSFTFVATAHALQWQEITPVFCDIEPDRHTLDPDRVEELITPRTTGIIGVHVWGQPCDTDRLGEIAQRRGLRLLYDAAHAIGCTRGGKRIGGFGDAEALSFHATKVLNSFEGGAVVTNNEALARTMRLMKNFGFVDYDRTESIGTNGKMSEVSAAMGLTSLESLDEFVAANRRNYRAYARGLTDIPGLRLLPHDEGERCNYHYVVLEINGDKFGLTRDGLVQALHAEKILARRYFHPGCHRMEPYRSFFPHAGLSLPVTERVASQVLVLPTGTAVGEAEIAEVCGIIRLCCNHAAEIRRRTTEKGLR